MKPPPMSTAATEAETAGPGAPSSSARAPEAAA
ncbi:hypothetical protein RKD18_004161 [Streptomyces phaeoluteigriseus]